MPKSLRAEPYLQCVFALDTVLERKKLESSIFVFEFNMVAALQIIIKLKKVKADGLKVRQDNRAPIGPSSITIWMMFTRVRWLKD